MALRPGHSGGERGPRMVWGLEPEPRELGVGFGLSLRGLLAPGVFGRVALGLHLGGAVNEQRRPRAKGSECPAPTGKSSARGTSTLEPPVREPTHLSHGRLTAHIGLLSRWGAQAQAREGAGFCPQILQTRLSHEGGQASPTCSHFSSFPLLPPALLKITGRDQSIISYL